MFLIYATALPYIEGLGNICQRNICDKLVDEHAHQKVELVYMILMAESFLVMLQAFTDLTISAVIL